MTEKDEIRIGFIGAGNHASWTLYPCFQYFPRINLVSVCDLDEGKAKSVGRRFGADTLYGDYRRMLDVEKLDAIFCCGGPTLHASVIGEAIARRLPLFVEKPPAPTSAELRLLARNAIDSETPIMVGFMHRFAPLTIWARKAMASEQFGRTRAIYAREGIWGTGERALVLDSGIHHIDMLRYLGGEVEWLQAARCSDGDRRHAIAVILWFKNGILGQLSLNSLETLSTPSDVVEIHGDKGQWVRLENWCKGTWYRDPGVFCGPPEDPADSALVYEHSWTAAGTNRSSAMQGYVGEIAHFLQSVQNDGNCSPDLQDGYRDLELVEAINRSAASGEKVRISDEDARDEA